MVPEAIRPSDRLYRGWYFSLNLLQGSSNCSWNNLDLIPMPLYDLHMQTRPSPTRLAVSTGMWLFFMSRHFVRFGRLYCFFKWSTEEELSLAVWEKTGRPNQIRYFICCESSLLSTFLPRQWPLVDVVIITMAKKEVRSAEGGGWGRSLG